jgi:amino acid transporter
MFQLRYASWQSRRSSSVASALIFGFLTRIATFGIGVNMLVAIMTVHRAFGFFMNFRGTQKGEGFEFHLLVLAIVVCLMIRGAGAFSIDRLLTLSVLSGKAESRLAHSRAEESTRVSNMQIDVVFPVQSLQASAMARSSATALSGLKFVCVDTYFPTAFAMSTRHDALARMPAVSANSAISCASS